MAPEEAFQSSTRGTQGWSLPAWHLLVSILDRYCVGPVSGRGIVDSVGAISIITHLHRLSHTWERGVESAEPPGTLPYLLPSLLQTFCTCRA